MRAVTSGAPVAPVSGTGSAAGGQVRITLSAGSLEYCEVDPDWVANESQQEIEAALADALGAARSDLHDQQRRQRGPAIDALVNEALAAVSALCSGNSQTKGQ